MLMIPTASSQLEVNFYQGTITSTTRFAGPFTGSGCVNLAGSYGSPTKVTIANSGGTARACIVNGATTDEVRLFNARITLLQATTIVIEIKTGSGELKTGPTCLNNAATCPLVFCRRFKKCRGAQQQ